ncbi:MAG: TlpA disulfide reductase family protein [Bacteroidota bacterium]
MKTLFLLPLFFCACAFAQPSATGGFTLKGTLEFYDSAYQDWMYLNYEGKKDSVKVVDGSYTFSGRVEKPVMAWVHAKPNSLVAWLFLENSEISLTTLYWTSDQEGTLWRGLDIRSIEGSRSEQSLRDYKDFYAAEKDASNFPQQLQAYLERMMEDSFLHPVAGKILADIALSRKTLDGSAIEALFAQLDPERIQADDAEIIRQTLKSLSEFQTGNAFLAFALPDTLGEILSLEQLSSRYTLVDFWASWCGPCRQQHPALKEVFETYSSLGFDIWGISVDKNPGAWKMAIREDNLPWTQLQDEESEVSNALGIQAIPSNYLLDQQGKIVAVNLEPEELSDFLKVKLRE